MRLASVRFLSLALSTVMVLTTGLHSSRAWAQRMNAETHTLVIEKMEAVLKKAREDETLSLRPIRARLADLYAERARLRAMEEVEQNCQNCTGARDDRKRALQLYPSVVKDASKERQGPLLIQMAHLHEISNDPRQAERVYRQVFAGGTKTYDQTSVALAYAGRAELQFARGEFRQAKKNFETSLRLSEPLKRGYLTYRVAWCHLNLGDQPGAVQKLVKILKSPDLLTRHSTQGPVLDESFQEDVARDLATFVARGSVSARDIELVESLSPERAKRDIIHHLASELERLGNKPAALEAWAVFIKYEQSPIDRLEAMVRVARIRFDLNRRKQALEDLKQAMEFWKKVGCSVRDTCLPLQMRLRDLVFDWSRVEKKRPTTNLLAAYEAYIDVFTSDVPMFIGASEVARRLRHNRTAVSLYRKTSILAAQALSRRAPLNPSEKSASEKDLKETREIFEAALVGEIEMAELLKDPKLRESAYDHYLNLNPHGKMAMTVRYQRARLAYEQNDHRTAAKRFHEFTSSEYCQDLNKKSKHRRLNREYCLKAADLHIDTLVLLKDEGDLERQALAYSSQISERRLEYLRVARKAALNQVVQTTNNEKSSRGETVRALEKLKSISLAGASNDERLAYYKNRLKLAERARDLDETQIAAAGMLALRGLSDADQEWALSRQAWAAEMAFDFRKAYNISRKLKMPEISAADRHLRLAVLAEMAGRNPRSHEEDYLRVERSSARSALLRAKMVRSARSPSREFARHQDELAHFPEIYASLALEIYAQKKSRSFAEKALKVRGVHRTPEGRVLARQVFLEDFSKSQRQLRRHKIRSSSDHLLNKTLLERVNLLNEVEEATAQAVRSDDWIAEIVTLSVLSEENLRLYREILALPVPRHLKKSERASYRKLVVNRARPFYDKYLAIFKKLSTIWGQSSSFDSLSKEYQASRDDLKPLLADDIRRIASVAPKPVQSRLQRTLGKKDRSRKPTQRQLVAARDDVKKKPFQARPLKVLRDLEEQKGRDTVVTYLDARLTKLQRGEM